MKALMYEGPKIMNIRQVPIPETGELDVLIRVERVGICGSELSGYLGHNSLRKPPLIMGHEFSGIITKVGSRVDRFREGDRVTCNPLVSCGICHECTTGFAQLCASRSLLGAHRPGAFAEYVLAPEKNVYHLPDHVSLELGALAEPLACAVHVCRLLSLSPEERLLIIGAGPIGLLVLQSARQFGLDDIVVMDIQRDRLAIAEELGALGADSDDELNKLKPQRGFNAAVDAVGLDVTRNQCLKSVSLGGKVVFSGLHKAESPLPINDVIRSELKMFGAFGYAPYDFDIAVEWLGKGKIDLLNWVMYAPLEQGGLCFEKLIKNPGNVAKILLTL